MGCRDQLCSLVCTLNQLQPLARDKRRSETIPSHETRSYRVHKQKASKCLYAIRTESWITWSGISECYDGMQILLKYENLMSDWHLNFRNSIMFLQYGRWLCSMSTWELRRNIYRLVRFEFWSLWEPLLSFILTMWSIDWRESLSSPARLKAFQKCMSLHARTHSHTHMCKHVHM